MAVGNSYFTQSQMVPESVAGTAVDVATRALQSKIIPKDDRTRKLVEQARADFGGSNRHVDVAKQSAWSYDTYVEPNEDAYFVAAAMGVATITDADGGAGVTSLHTFTEASTTAPVAPQTLTLYTGDDLEQVRSAGCAVTKFEYKFAGKNEVMRTCEFIGRSIGVNGFTALTFPTVANTDILLALKTKVWCDTSAAALGTNQLAGQVYEATFTYETGIGDDRTLDGSTEMYGFTRKSPVGRLKLLAKWSTEMVAQLAAYDAITRQFFRVSTTGKVVTGSSVYGLMIDGAYQCEEFAILGPPRDGFNICEATYLLTSDETWTKRLMIMIQNKLPAYV